MSAPSVASAPAQPRPDAPAKASSRAGRNLPAAIGVAAVLLAAIGLSLWLFPPAFVALAVVATAIGCYELARAATTQQVQVPVVGLWIACLTILTGAWLWDVAGAFGGLAAGTVAVFVGVFVLSTPTTAARNLLVGIFTMVYVPLMASFAVLMLREDNGVAILLTFLFLPIANDTGGYVAGVLFGKHPMAPSISPKKSWEGAAGSLIASALLGALFFAFALDRPWWLGVILGALVVVTATVGDLAESLVKRDLGLKDMGTILPGHGGVLDRLDSLLMTAPVAYLLLVLVPRIGA